MSYDPNVPKELKEIQAWFASVITQPVDQESHINPISPSGKPISKEAKRYITPSPTLDSVERIELYNQQYWWRLLSTLQSTFLLATNLLGYRRFNELIAVPFLEKFPSQHFSLSHLGKRLPGWIKEDYQGADQELLVNAIAIDEAFNESFFSAHHSPITEGCEPEEAFKKRAWLQPHIYLFQMDYDLFSFRAKINQKDPDFWSNHHYPTLKQAFSEDESHFPELKRDRQHYFVIFRSTKNIVLWESMSEIQYQLLQLFKPGLSIEEVCIWLSNEGSAFISEAQSLLQTWIQTWISRQWLFNRAQD